MRTFVICLLTLLCATTLCAQKLSETVLPLSGTRNAAGTELQISWEDAAKLRVGPIDINRRDYAFRTSTPWAPLTPQLRPVWGYTDTTLKPGQIYEYQVIRSARDVVDVGYWITGTEIPALETRGVALVVIEDGLHDTMAAHLDRFTLDLIGDGWRVRQITAPRHNRDTAANMDAALRLKAWVAEEYARAPETPHSLILIGHVPVVKSGRTAPDGHKPVPHATDLFYADVSSTWPLRADGLLRPNRVPDLAIEMSVGRIDFAPIREKDRGAEQRLLRAYFDKMHHWRHARLGDLRRAYGSGIGLRAERYALRNIVGPDAVVEGDHIGVGTERPHLWGVDFGKPKLTEYPDLGNKSVFAINFGSHKQKFTNTNNAMIGLLAQPWYTLAVGWGARPAWWLHPMAMGATIGDVHLRTVNNGAIFGPYRDVLDYWPTGQYLWRNPIWVNLMGDPTAHAFPLPPASNLRATAQNGQVTLDWDAPARGDVRGYRIYRAQGPDQAFTALEGGTLIRDTQFVDNRPPKDALYMVRAYGLQNVHAGSFFALSQAVFARVDQDSIAVPPVTLSTPADTALRIDLRTFTPAGADLTSFLEGPAEGDLRQDATGWLFTPAPGFTGDIPLRWSAGNALETRISTMTITVTP